MPAIRKEFPVWAKDYQTYTGLYPGDGTVITVRARGLWGIWGNNRLCSAAGDAEADNNNGGPWPVAGVPEGTLLAWFGGQVHYWQWSRLGDNDYQTTFAYQGNGELGFGPNDNNMGDNTNGGFLTVDVAW